jgi:hypothetical protein
MIEFKAFIDFCEIGEIVSIFTLLIIMFPHTHGRYLIKQATASHKY